MRDVRSAPAPKPGDPKIAYSAEDIRIQQYDDAVIVAFRLVRMTEKDKKIVATSYLNTATFLKRNGKWQAVNWQATRIPRHAEETEEVRKEVAATQAIFHQALLTADLKTLDALADESFIWMHRDGKQATKRQLLDELGSGQLKYSKLETSNVTVAVYDDSAVVRGTSRRQRNAVPGSTGSGDASAFTAFYTMAFINRGGDWKAVAMDTSHH